MNLYDRLKDKKKFELLGKDHKILNAECVIKMSRVSYVTELKVSDATDIFWTIYPNEPFDLTKYYKLFNN
jgi:hypothetical protein